jgi:hypothetical protein
VSASRVRQFDLKNFFGLGSWRNGFRSHFPRFAQKRKWAAHPTHQSIYSMTQSIPGGHIEMSSRADPNNTTVYVRLFWNVNAFFAFQLILCILTKFHYSENLRLTKTLQLREFCPNFFIFSKIKLFVFAKFCENNSTSCKKQQTFQAALRISSRQTLILAKKFWKSFFDITSGESTFFHFREKFCHNFCMFSR